VPKKVIALCMTAESRFVNTYCEFVESGCLGVQPKVGGKFLLKLNNGERPIANKYREGKMQRTLKRELKVLEIVKREAIGSSTCLLSTHLSVEDWYGVVSSPSWLSQHCVLVFYRWSILVVGESTSVRRVGEWSEGGDMLVALGLLVCVKL
jgi:hypothetical protein